MSKEKINKIFDKTVGAIAAFLITFITTCNSIYATNTYAEKGARWILDGLFWVVAVAAISGIAFAIIKRNLVGAVSIIVGAALALIIINDPQILVTLGTTLKGIVGL